MADQKPDHPNRKHRTGDTLSVNVAGVAMGWNGGVFSGPKASVERAQLAADIGEIVNLYGATIAANNTSALGALAAMAAASPGRTVVVDAPDDVIAVLDAAHTDPTDFH